MLWEFTILNRKWNHLLCSSRKMSSCFWTEAGYTGMLWNFKCGWCVLLSFHGVINSCFSLRIFWLKGIFNCYTNPTDFCRSLFLWANIENNLRLSVKCFPEEKSLSGSLLSIWEKVKVLELDVRSGWWSLNSRGWTLATTFLALAFQNNVLL